MRWYVDLRTPVACCLVIAAATIIAVCDSAASILLEEKLAGSLIAPFVLHPLSLTRQLIIQFYLKPPGSGFA